MEGPGFVLKIEEDKALDVIRAIHPLLGMIGYAAQLSCGHWVVNCRCHTTDHVEDALDAKVWLRAHDTVGMME
jgi:hypothetical protein